MKLNEAVAVKLQTIIKEKGISKIAICKVTKLSRSTVYRIINGKNKDIRSDTLAKIVLSLNIRLRDFFADSIFNFENLED